MKLAPLGACYMVAFHGVQVEAARAFRMYSQGVLLAATTAWLLLAALGARECRRRCWLAYGVAVGLFCYTHYYAFFTLLAQGLFVVGDLTLRWRKSGWAAVREPAKGLALASLIALAVFSPWIRVLSAQTSDVWHSYWIREVVWSQLAQSFAMWALGFRAYGASLWLALGAAGALIIFTLWRGGRAGFFFLIQALLPWALSLGISVFGSRPIFVDRYLVFASFAWICLWGVALANLRGLVRRVCLASFVLGCASYGLAQEMQTWPDRPPALANASTFLRNRYHRGDVVLVNSGPTVNLVRYYCGQAALRDMDVRCTDNVPHRGGHVVHVASLEASEFWVEPQRPDDLPPRIWIATLDGSAPRPPEAMRRILERSFEGGGHTKCALALYERAQ